MQAMSSVVQVKRVAHVKLAYRERKVRKEILASMVVLADRETVARLDNTDRKDYLEMTDGPVYPASLAHRYVSVQ